MNIVDYGLYKMYDSYFRRFNSKNMVHNKSENRPFYCAYTDSSGIVWFIPLSSQTASYKAKIEKDKQKHGACLFYHIGVIAEVERVFLIGNMIPVSDEYVKEEFTIKGIHYVVRNQETIKEVHKRAAKYLALVKSRKLKPSIDIEHIIKELT